MLYDDSNKLIFLPQKETKIFEMFNRYSKVYKILRQAHDEII
ncbi:Uncharacterised protein [Chryseobacterium indoltheticum]|uniref:Uncharacterized protein n=1 Tax=Chryseobacterium indoltheticum TaxID=254 RepID=A0A381FQW1_9FLAO|nr:Uncharacterised protein [Chryseobacterium indoltheticum]